jgi:uncharacterized membrane protein (DUF2068 family)
VGDLRAQPEWLCHESQDAGLKAGTTTKVRRAALNWSDKNMVRAIAVFKLAKASLLLLVAFAALRLVHADVVDLLERWVLRIGIGSGSGYVGRLLVEAAALTPNRIRDVSVGSFIYAALFLTEGIGLWLLKRWAEWLTIVITSSLVPVEVWEIWRRPNVAKVLVLVINLALVGYLIWQVRKEEAVRR